MDVRRAFSRLARLLKASTGGQALGQLDQGVALFLLAGKALGGHPRGLLRLPLGLLGAVHLPQQRGGLQTTLHKIGRPRGLLQLEGGDSLQNVAQRFIQASKAAG